MKIFILIFLFSSLFSWLGCNNKLIQTIKTADSLKKYYCFDELNLLIKNLNHSIQNDDRIIWIKADWAYFQMDYLKADSLFDEILKKHPNDIKALNGKALIASDHGEIEKSIVFLEKALQIDSTSVYSLINYANVILKSGNSKKYILLIDKILKLDSINTDALYGKGHYLCRYKYDLKNGVKFLNKAIEAFPLNRKAHNFLGRGYSPSTYHDEKDFDKKYSEIDSLLRRNQFDRAYSIINEKFSNDTGNLTSLKFRAATEFHRGNYKKCIYYSFKILKIQPNYGLAHYFISEALIKMEEKYNLQLAKFKAVFLNKKNIDTIPWLDKVFINYTQCDSLLQKSIKINIAPFKGFMEALYKSGATVYFKDFHHLLWHCPFLENTKGTYTADFRLTDDIGGQGGYHTNSEKILQTNSIYGGYNIAFHEIAHLIHWVLTKNELEEIKKLFIQAKKGKYTLDWYAELNEREYFAQGIEAYLSNIKIPRQSAEYSNTKEILLKKDKKLFNFIEYLIHKKSYQENVVQAFILKSQYSETNALAIKYIQEGLKVFPDNANLLIELGYIYQLDNNLDNAIQIHKNILKADTSNINAAIALASDYFLLQKSPSESINLLKPYFNEQTKNFELCLNLGYYYVKDKNYQAAILPLEKAIELNPFPDPYIMSIADAFYLLGKCKMETLQFESAEKLLILSINHNSRNIDAYFDLIFVKLKQNKKDEAVKYFEIVKKLSPENSKINDINHLFNTTK